MGDIVDEVDGEHNSAFQALKFFLETFTACQHVCDALVDEGDEVGEKRSHAFFVEAVRVILLVIGHELSDKKNAVTHTSDLHPPFLLALETLAKAHAALKDAHSIPEDHILSSLLM